MQKLFLVLISIILFANPILKLDTFGHTGIIRDIIVNGDEIISASDDKTIRVWDVKTGIEKRKILGEIGSGGNGMIYAIALSKNKKYLAVGGFLAEEHGINDLVGAIRIYDYNSGKLLKVLKSHKNAISDLYFSDDYLISGSADKTVKVWDKNFNLVDTIYAHKNSVYAVGAFKHYIVSAGDDNKVYLYDLQTHKIINSFKASFKLRYIAINKIKHQIAVSGLGKTIYIFDYNLNLLKTIQNDTMAVGLKYSPNGEYLIVGAGSYPSNVNIYFTYNYTLYSSFKKHTNLVMAVNFIDNHTAVSGGGDNFEIYIWDIDSAKIKQKIVGVGQSVWNVGIDGDKIAFGNKSNYKSQNNCGPLQKYINLDDFSIHKVNQTFKRISTINGRYSLIHSKGGEDGDDDAVLNIKKDGITIAKIVKHSYDGLEHRCYGWWGDYIISGGDNGHLKVYDKEGKEVASLIGHTGEVWSIAIDGDRLVSGSDDQTIRVWDLSKLREGVKKIYPMLNIFVSKDNDYVVWSNSGYFASSPKGAKYIGYYINQGDNKEARFVSVDKYFDKYYRPDIIHYILQTGSEKMAIRFANKTKKVQQVDITNSLPPVITLLSKDNIKTKHKTISIKYKIESNSPITKLEVVVNGKKINKRALKLHKNRDYKILTITLNNGQNIITIRAKNRYAWSDDVYIKAYYQGEKLIYKPNLYILSIGVSKYKNPEYNLDVADKDARSFVRLFKNFQGTIYNKVITKTLTNEEANKDNILDALDWLSSEVTQKDVAMIFIAGHGINDDKGKYYFLPYNANLKHLRRTSVKWNDITDTIEDIPGKILVFADTCHSGNIAGTRRDVTSAVKSIIDSSNGAIIFTATTGSGYSYENSKWGHGAFTKAILDGIGKFKADYNQDNIITIKELDLFITNDVKKLTDGKQKPTTIVPRSVPDFAVGGK